MLTPGGSKPIEHFVAGDEVLSAPEDDPDASPFPRRVAAVFQTYMPLLDLRVGGRVIRTTAEHPFWVLGRGWVDAQQLRPGDELRSHDGPSAVIESVEGPTGAEPVYNLEVSGYHTYFVGAPQWGFGVWAHNAIEDCLSIFPVGKDLASIPGLSYDLRHINKHLPGTKESAKLLRKEGAAHVFNDKATLSQAEAAIFERGQKTGLVRGTERHGLMFEEPVGYRISQDGSRIPLNYAELKLSPDGRYHILPRTGPSQ